MKLKKIAVSAAAALLLMTSGAGFYSANLHNDIDDMVMITAYADYDDNDILYAAVDYDEPENAENTERSSDSQRRFNPVMAFIICFVIGLLIAFIVVGSMKSQMKTVRSQSGASNYKKNDSFKLNESKDTFLYKKLDKTPRAGSASQTGARPNPPPGRK